MELYLLRHGVAEEQDPLKYRDDSKRPLTAQGIKKMEQIAKGAKKFGLELDLILSSPYTRARQTAETFAKVFGATKKLKYLAQLEATASFKRLISELNQKYSSYQKIVLVGHEPYLSRLLSNLLIGDDEIEIDFKKGGLAKVSIEKLTQKKCAVLNWLLTPKQLRKIA